MKASRFPDPRKVFTLKQVPDDIRRLSHGVERPKAASERRRLLRKTYGLKPHSTTPHNTPTA